MRASPTSSTVTWPSVTPAAASAASAGSRSASGARMSSSSIRTSALLAARLTQRRRLLLGVLVVRGHDPLNELVTHDVLAAEAHELDALDLLEDLADDDEPRGLVLGKVDLGDVARHDHLRVESEPGEEHLDLLLARVLGLVEDHERIVKAAPAHEGQWGDLDDAAVDVLVDLFWLEHVVEGVEQRPQVGVHLRSD